jgi:trypsin
MRLDRCEQARSGAGRPRRRAGRAALAAVILLSAGLGASGLAPAGAVVDGREADSGEWPWQVALMVEGGQWCGGTLVGAQHVVTAAHCTDTLRPQQIVVLAGTVDIDRGGQRRSVSAIHQHEGYHELTLRHDIALLELAQPFELSADIQVIPLATEAETTTLTEEGDPAFITGFGATDENDSGSSLLLEAEVLTYGDQRCTDLYRQDGEDIYGDSQVCAGLDAGGADACYGDSGGPLVVPLDGTDGSERDDWVQVGVVSWGAGCGRPLRPTVYTEVSAYADWLIERGLVMVTGTEFEGGGARLPARGTEGKASRYPLTLDVEGFEGEVRTAAVRLVGLSHSRPSDLDMWLVAPDGTAVTLLSDAGGEEVEGAELTIFGRAGAAEPDAAFGPATGPTDLEADEQWSGRRPAADLALLTGIDPNGQWELLVADDERGAVGSLESWVLILD